MITRLHIQKYKCLNDEEMIFRPLTVLAGTNGSGKSSVLQAILLLAYNLNPKNREKMSGMVSECQKLNCAIRMTLDGTEYAYTKGENINREADILCIGDSLYFLGSDGIGPEGITKMVKEYEGKSNATIIIDKPETHLHPRFQFQLGKIFASLAARGIQLVIETHCEHLLSSLRYQVYKERLRPDDVIIYYKKDAETEFEAIHINRNGRYADKEGRQRSFPAGFFDVSVHQLLEIG